MPKCAAGAPRTQQPAANRPRPRTRQAALDALHEYYARTEATVAAQSDEIAALRSRLEEVEAAAGGAASARCGGGFQDTLAGRQGPCFAGCAALFTPCCS